MESFQEVYEPFKESTELKELTKLMSDCAASNEGRSIEVKVGRTWEYNDMKTFERLLNEIYGVFQHF